MALPQIVSRNQIQGIPTTALNTRLVGASLVFYTCPTGKKAIITGTSQCTGLGAATDVRLVIDGVNILTWDSVNVGDTFPFECQLDAADTLEKSQNSGTNGEVNVNAKILETPA